MSEYRCHKCGAAWESSARQPGVKATCEGCGAYLHCCKNCRYHRPGMHNECYIPNTDWVGDRSALNFCDEFCFRMAETSAAGDDPAERARAQAEALLGGGTKPPTLDDLFGGDTAEEAADGDAESRLGG